MKRVLRTRHSPALALSLVAVILALGGGAYAATSGGGTIVVCVHRHGGGLYRASRCARHDTALSWNARGPQGPRGPAGRTGAKGDTGLTGVKGDTGPAGPGAISFDRQFPIDNSEHELTVGGVIIAGACGTPPLAEAIVQNSDSSHGFYGWGTMAKDGTLSRPSVNPNVNNGSIIAQGTSTAELDVVAESTAPGAQVLWTRVDITVVRGSACNFHAMVTPSSSAG
jgi:hypothetical protein